MVDDIYGSSISNSQTPVLPKRLSQGKNPSEDNLIDSRKSALGGMREDSVTISTLTDSVLKVTVPDDAKPATRPIETETGTVETFRKAITDSRGNTIGYKYYATNNSNLPVEVGVGVNDKGNNVNYKTDKDLKTIQRLKDGSIDPDSLKTFQMGPHESIELFTVKPGKSTEAWAMSPYFVPRAGSSDAKHNDKVRYRAPFPKGVSWRVAQGENNLGGTHAPGTDNAFAIDFVTDESDKEKKVTAMRSGTVVKIKEDSNEGGPNVSEDKANEIWILHDDGSIAKYIHLKQGSATEAGIKEGDQIKTGQVIGNYGLTGKTDGPHLHVQVDLPKGLQDEEYISIAGRFQGQNGAPIQKLEKGASQ